MKESPTSDFYVCWSSVVEAPTAWGNRVEIAAYVVRDAEERLTRADNTGTSCLWVTLAGMRDRYPEEGAWDDDSYIYEQRGTITRAGVFQLARRLDENPHADARDLITPFED